MYMHIHIFLYVYRNTYKCIYTYTDIHTNSYMYLHT